MCSKLSASVIALLLGLSQMVLGEGKNIYGLNSYSIIMVVGFTDGNCLTGFPSLETVTSNSCSRSSCTFMNGLRLFPTMMISCNGTLQRLTVAGMFDSGNRANNANRLYPTLQIWRRLHGNSTTYEKIEHSSISRCSLKSNNVQRCTLDSPISVEMGDIIAIGIRPQAPGPRQTLFKIYFSSAGDHTPNYLLQSGTQTFILPSSEVHSNPNSQPLIYLNITEGK